MSDITEKDWDELRDAISLEAHDDRMTRRAREAEEELERLRVDRDRLAGEMRAAVDEIQHGLVEDAIQRLLNAADHTPASDEGLRSGREDDDDPR